MGKIHEPSREQFTSLTWTLVTNNDEKDEDEKSTTKAHLSQR